MTREQDGPQEPKPGRHKITGLPDEVAMVASLERSSRELPGHFGLVAGDLNGLKSINDSVGHLGGNEYLRRFATHLVTVLRGSDEAFMVSHHGGDEFMILLHGAQNQQQLEGFIKRLQIDLENRGFSIALGGRIHRPGESIEELMNDADKLMYANKIQGKLDKYDERQLRIIKKIGRLAGRHDIDQRDVPAILDYFKKQPGSSYKGNY